MPKLIDYPRNSFKKAMDLASAVDYLGGNCSQQTCAEKMGLKVTGSFRALVASANKHKLIEIKASKLYTTPLFKNIKLAYTESEKKELQQTAFLYPGVYHKIYEKFKNSELPISMLDKILIREYGVAEKDASKIATYFIEGAKLTSILVNGVINDIGNNNSDNDEEDFEEDNADEANVSVQPSKNIVKTAEPAHSTFLETNGLYTIHIYGPSIDTKLIISEEEDFLILNAVLSKLKKKLKENG